MHSILWPGPGHSPVGAPEAARVPKLFACRLSGLTPFAEVRLGGLLGKGSFGSVYLGWRGDQEIAVKVGVPHCPCVHLVAPQLVVNRWQSQQRLPATEHAPPQHGRCGGCLLPGCC